MSILSVGTVAFDCVETPYGKKEDVLGGSVSFLGVAASYFTTVGMVAVIGEDFPEEHLEFFRSRDIDTTGVNRQPGKTFRWRGHYMDDINVAKTLDTQLNVLAGFNPDLPEHFKDARYVVLGNIDPELQTHVVNQVRNPALVACDTMNFWIEGAHEPLLQTLQKVDLLSINDAEARSLSGKDNLLQAAAEIRKMGPRLLVIKRGEHGALVFFEDEIFAAPAFPLDVVKDPTGAGDSFAGGMMGYLARKGTLDAPTLRQAVIMGSVLASYAVQDFSLDRFRTLTHQDIQARFKAFHQLTQFSTDGLGF
ncbi:MAG: PfkB family carbohydrate kinase [Myxococcota bacterium]|nr:PfkB family carbohydrate kinase [Myxococcota bacterium]